MPALHRKLVLMAAGGAIAMVAIVAACGLDENGIIGGGADASAGDVVSSDVLVIPDIQIDTYVAPACSDPDASLDASCLGAPVPDGWQPIGFKVGQGGLACPGATGDFIEKDYVKDPTPDPNSCLCAGCAANGDWACHGALYAGSTCAGYIDAGTGASFCAVTSHISYAATLTRTGAPTCAGAQQTGTQDASATVVGACIPQRCEADFCGLQNLSLCIYSTSVTDGGCPTDFPTGTIVGTQAYTACTGCTCGLTNADAGCTGTVTDFAGSDCDAGGETTQAADGQCQSSLLTLGYNSLLLKQKVPTPSCAPSTSTGQGELAGLVTICCRP